MKLEVRFPRLLTGLAIGLALTVGVGAWLQARAAQRQRAETAERSGVVGLRALGDLVENLGLDDERLQRAVAVFVAADPGLEVARVVRFKGIRLVASTAPGDVGDDAAPRKMARDEKPLYDLGQALRAAVETNLKEGRAWKEEIDVQTLAGDRLELAGPVQEGPVTEGPAEADGQVAGAVLVETGAEAPRGGAPASGAGTLATLAALLVPLVLLVALRPLLAGRGVAALAVAALLLVAATWFHGRRGLDALSAGQRAAEQGIAGRLASAAVAFEAAFASLGEPAPAVETSAWDSDRFRRPLGRVTAAGVDEAVLTRTLAVNRGTYGRLMLPVGALGLVLLAWFGLGGAATAGGALLRHRRAYGYVMPAMVAMVVLVFFPFSYGIALSFTNANIYNTDQGIAETWIGLQNFTEILTDWKLVENTPEGRVFDYQNFYWTLGFTVVWTVSNVAIGVSLGLLLALILNTRGLALRPIYRVLLILPWAVPNYITALIWRGMFHSQFGVINQVIQIFGGSAVSWFDTPLTAFVTVLSTNGWLSFPFMMVISLGALQSIPADLYEAARVDGASRWQQFRTITLPSLKPALVPAVILSVIWTFNQFNVIYLVSAGEPGYATEILITESYKLAFEQYRYGYAAAYSVVIFIILLAYGVWQNRVTRATEGI